jgi:hypothetical protein
MTPSGTYNQNRVVLLELFSPISSLLQLLVIREGKEWFAVMGMSGLNSRKAPFIDQGRTKQPEILMPRGDPREVTASVRCPREVREIKTFPKWGRYSIDETTWPHLGHGPRYAAH